VPSQKSASGMFGLLLFFGASSYRLFLAGGVNETNFCDVVKTAGGRNRWYRDCGSTAGTDATRQRIANDDPLRDAGDSRSAKKGLTFTLEWPATWCAVSVTEKISLSPKRAGKS
jgi:hypothetical protein